VVGDSQHTDDIAQHTDEMCKHPDDLLTSPSTDDRHPTDRLTVDRGRRDLDDLTGKVGGGEVMCYNWRVVNGRW